MADAPAPAALIHFAAVSPAPAVLCESKAPRTPASNRWAVVNCMDCVRVGAEYDPDARARLVVLEARAQGAKA